MELSTLLWMSLLAESNVALHEVTLGDFLGLMSPSLLSFCSALFP